MKLFKWNDNEKGDNEWIEIDKVCGRNTPGPYNSTSTRLKVLFHSNEAIEGDGFRALWYQDCGGVFEVTKEMKYIKSPNYPSSYKRNQFCNYTLIAPEKNIIVDFLDFQVEQGNKGINKFFMNKMLLNILRRSSSVIAKNSRVYRVSGNRD